MWTCASLCNMACIGQPILFIRLPYMRRMRQSSSYSGGLSRLCALCARFRSTCMSVTQWATPRTAKVVLVAFWVGNKWQRKSAHFVNTSKMRHFAHVHETLRRECGLTLGSHLCVVHVGQPVHFNRQAYVGQTRQRNSRTFLGVAVRVFFFYLTLLTQKCTSTGCVHGTCRCEWSAKL